MTNEDELDIKEVPMGAYNFMDCWHTDDRGGYQGDRGVHPQFPGSSSITVPGHEALLPRTQSSFSAVIIYSW